MAQTLPPEHVKAIDLLRMRLAGLSTSIAFLSEALAAPQNDPLLAWPELQKASSNIGQHLDSLASALSAQRQLFTLLHLHPLPNFPGHTQKDLLAQLVRKKLDPNAQAWIEESVKISKERSNGVVASPETGTMTVDGMKDLWSSAVDIQQEVLAPWMDQELFGDVFTAQERENGVKNVVTGLKRDLAAEDDEDEDGNGDQMVEDAASPDAVQASAANGLNASLAPLSLDSMLKFAHGQDIS
ncbi:Mediator of RNA polymerase II transcription subunit 8 [Cercospora zeina]